MRRVNGSQNGQAIRANCAMMAGMRQTHETMIRGLGIENPQSVNISDATKSTPVRNARFAAVVCRAMSSAINATALHANNASNVNINGSVAKRSTTAARGTAVNHRRSNDAARSVVASAGASCGLGSMVFQWLTEGFYDTVLNGASEYELRQILPRRAHVAKHGMCAEGLAQKTTLAAADRTKQLGEKDAKERRVENARRENEQSMIEASHVAGCVRAEPGDIHKKCRNTNHHGEYKQSQCRGANQAE